MFRTGTATDDPGETTKIGAVNMEAGDLVETTVSRVPVGVVLCSVQERQQVMLEKLQKMIWSGTAVSGIPIGYDNVLCSVRVAQRRSGQNGNR